MLHVWRRVNIDKYIFLWFYSISYDRFNEIDEHVSWQEVNQFPRTVPYRYIIFNQQSCTKFGFEHIRCSKSCSKQSGDGNNQGLSHIFKTPMGRISLWDTKTFARERFQNDSFFFAIGLLKNSVNSYQRWNLGLIQKVFRMSWLLKGIQKTNCLFLSGEKGVESTNF